MEKLKINYWTDCLKVDLEAQKKALKENGYTIEKVEDLTNQGYYNYFRVRYSKIMAQYEADKTFDL